MQVKINKHLFIDLLDKWKEQNPSCVHPTTEFLDSMGLHYNRLIFLSGEYLCTVVDEKKYLVAKIKYGI
jgi:hypothetical protein